MKICWDNLEKLNYSRKTGKWYKGTTKYVYKDCCKGCGEPFLASTKKVVYCSCKCRNSDKNYIDKVDKNRKILKGVDNPFYGKHHTKKVRKYLSEMRKGNPAYLKYGENAPCWKGGYHSKNIPLYDTYAPQIDWCEEVRRGLNDRNVLEVRCTYCGKWYTPKRYDVRSRIQSLKGNYEGENRLYCSDGCKQVCPIYNKKPEYLMKQDAVRAGRLQWLELDREVQPELRKMVFERDEYTCQKCGIQNKPIHCHHILPVSTNPIESADVDNCITYCIDCHKKAHDQDGCRYKDLQEEVC